MHPYVFPPQNLSSSVNQVVVTVSYSGQWVGAYGQCQVNYGDWQNAYSSLTTTSWQGTGGQAVTLTRPVETGDTMWVIVANALKLDSTSNQLTVTIAKSDRTTLVESSNSSSYGLVQVGYYFHGDYGQTFEYSGPPLPYSGATESLSLSRAHIWATSTGWAEAALVIKNTGGTYVVLDKIAVRGQECPWTNVYYNITTSAISADLPCNSSLNNNGVIEIGSANFTFTEASTDIILQSDKTIIIYIANPDDISVSDVGVTTRITVFSTTAQYYREVNVEYSLS